jgi:hypothetical protein
LSEIGQADAPFAATESPDEGQQRQDDKEYHHTRVAACPPFVPACKMLVFLIHEVVKR